MPAIPAWDAGPIYPLGYAISDRLPEIDPDLAFMCTYGEVPRGTILLDMTGSGMEVVGAKPAAYCAEIAERSSARCQEIAGGRKVNPWNGHEVSELLRRHDLASRMPRDGTGDPLRLRLFFALAQCLSLPAVSFHKSTFPESSAEHSG